VKRRPFQSQALLKIAARLKRGFNRLLVQWPTGVGKTVLFAGIPETLELGYRIGTGKRYRMLVLVHTDELVTQAVNRIRAWNPGITIGVEKAEQYAGNEQVVVASVQTLGRSGSKRIARFSRMEFGALVVDEAHHCTARTYMSILEHFNVWEDTDILLLGVTATPNRADGKGLGNIFSEIVDSMTLLEAINAGWLVNIRGVRIQTNVSLDSIRSLSDDNAVADLLDKPQLNDLVVRTWLQEAKGLPTVMFCANVQHSINLAAAFRAYGIGAEGVWGEDTERKRKLERHSNGEYDVICNCGVLTEGYDDPRIRCVGVVRDTDSEPLYTQMIGRGTRLETGINNLLEALAEGTKPSKTELLVMDFVGASSKHSLVTLPSLIGLSSDMDMRGRTITDVLEEVKQIQLRRPTFDITTLTDADRLKGVVREIDLIKVAYAPEVITCSKNQWFKQGPSAYVLILPQGEHIVVMSDVLEKWHISGTVEGHDIDGLHLRLEDAIRWADLQVRKWGSNKTASCVRRDVPWHKLPPVSSQIALAKRLGIGVHRGMTRGDLSQKINEQVAARQIARDIEKEERKKRLAAIVLE
jgi:superfamily II DNA or RNA helicase